VVEIGAGSGRLTVPLAAHAGTVLAIELDPHLAARLRERFARNPRVRVIEGDALDVLLPDEAFHVVGNIPFGRTTAILRRLVDDPRLPLERADLVVEWGLACKRARLRPSTLLGVYWGAWFELAVTRRLPRRCFEPAPRVDAALLRIVRRPLPLVQIAEARRYLAFLRAAFAGEDVLRGRAAKHAARELGLDPSSGPTELDQHQWAAVFAAVRSGPLDSARPKSFNSVL
jgi:23S rRNA (adenine-N6)-dimethyltransferase